MAIVIDVKWFQIHNYETLYIILLVTASYLLKITKIKYAKAVGRSNPITGQHLELLVELEENVDTKSFKKFLKLFFWDPFK